MQNHDLRLALIDGQFRTVSDLAPTGKDHFTFQLCHRAERFGDRQFEQWWMDFKSVYPTRNRSAANFEPIIDYWWQCCLQNGTDSDAGVCESFLLTSLFRNTRSNGSRRVFLDSIPRAGKHAERQANIENLENMLNSSFHDEKTIPEFSRDTGLMLGPPVYGEEVSDLCQEFTNELFGAAVPVLMNQKQERALSLVTDVWGTWRKQFDRRGHKELEKKVIDILSYEARAAVHRCYSHVWDAVTRWLALERECSVASLVFHRFWNLDLFWPPVTDDEHNRHLFHGHILGLHPAASSFVQTATGKQLIGDWLNVAEIGWEFTTHPESPELCRLLQGLHVSVSDYSNRHSIANVLRRTEPSQMPAEICFSDIVDSDGGYGSVSRRNERKSLAE